MKLLALSLGFAILSPSIFLNFAHADCISKYEAAAKEENVLNKSTSLRSVRIGNHILQSSSTGAEMGGVKCKDGCDPSLELLPIAAFDGIGLAVGAGFALAVPLKQGSDEKKDFTEIIEAIKQSKTYSKRESTLQNPLKKIVDRVLSENPELTAIEVAHIIAKANEQETFCTNKINRLKYFDHLVIL